MFCVNKDCNLCKRLVEFRENNKKKYPTFFNGAVPAFGDINSEVLIVGLAPGLKGANQTGRPFTNDYAGDLLYPTLKKYGFGEGDYKKIASDGFTLKNLRITNAVRCVPPENKPIGEEINNCNPFLKDEIDAMPNLKTIIALGGISHKAIIKAFELRQAEYKFIHGAVYKFDNINLIDSYHCSRYNTSTKRLTESMFLDIFEKVIKL